MVRSFVSVALLGAAFGIASSPASALTVTECSAKYQAAKQAGTLNGQKWNDFRKAECGTNAAPSATPAAAPAGSTVPNPMAPGGNKAAAPAPSAAPSPAPSATAPKPAPAAVGMAAFPAKVDPKYASEPAGKQRMHTCLDSYKAAKAAGTLGDLKWIQKGGGYYRRVQQAAEELTRPIPAEARTRRRAHYGITQTQAPPACA